MEPIIVICCCHNSCCLPYVRSMAFLISEFLIVQRTGRARRSTSFSARLLHLSRQICGRLTSNNPDHSLVDYQIWGISDSRQKCTHVDDLRQRLIDFWTGIQQSVIYNAIEWHRRLHTCMQAIGGHFEYSL